MINRGAEILRPGNTELCEAYNADLSRVEQLAGKMPSATAMLASMALLDAISDPVRGQILYALSQTELCVCELGELLNMSLPAVSHHIRVLKEAAFVEGRKKGRFVFYSLTKNEAQGHAVQLLLRLVRAEMKPGAASGPAGGTK